MAVLHRGSSCCNKLSEAMLAARCQRVLHRCLQTTRSSCWWSEAVLACLALTAPAAPLWTKLRAHTQPRCWHICRQLPKAAEPSGRVGGLLAHTVCQSQTFVAAPQKNKLLLCHVPHARVSSVSAYAACAAQATSSGVAEPHTSSAESILHCRGVRVQDGGASSLPLALSAVVHDGPNP